MLVCRKWNVASVMMTKLNDMIDLHQDIYLYTVYISQSGTFSLHWKSLVFITPKWISNAIDILVLLNSQIQKLEKKLKYQSVESDYTIFSCKFLNTHLTLIICCCSNIEIYFLQRSSYFACPRERSYMPHTIWEQRFLMEFMFAGVRFDECFLLN